MVSGAAGGVGSVAVQLAKRKGATVIGLAGPSNHDWLIRHDVIPVAYGDDAADRIHFDGAQFRRDIGWRALKRPG